jgi:hypothetical protein
VALTYNYILRQSGLRINAITGAVAATLQTDYIVSPLTTTEFQSTIFPFTAIQDAIRITEGKLATVIAYSGNDTLRSYISSLTAVLASGDSMPSVNASGAKMIGQYGSVLDADDPTIVCTAAPPQEIRRWNATASYWVIPFYKYSIDGNGITHTRPNGVVVQLCTYDGDAQRAAIEADDPILLADSLEDAYVAGTVSELIRDDEFEGQAAVYRAYFNDTLGQIKSGYTSTSQVAMPSPVLTQLSQ